MSYVVIRLHTWPRKALALGMLFGFIALLGWPALKIFVAEQLFEKLPSVEGFKLAIEWDRSNSDYYYYLGRLYHYSVEAANLPEAIRHYERAIELNPIVAHYWLDLGKAYEEQRDMAKAEEAFSYALRLAPSSPQTHWEAANFWLRLGDLDKTFLNFKVAAEGDPNKLDAVMHLSWQVSPNRERILNEVVANNLNSNLRFLYFALSKKDLSTALKAWRRVIDSNDDQFPIEESFRYIDTLVHENQISQAVQIWRQSLIKSGAQTRGPVNESGGNLVYNGGFESDILNGGFDWRVSPGTGFNLVRDMSDRIRDYHSLSINFDGKTNLDFNHLFQIVPLTTAAHGDRPSGDRPSNDARPNGTGRRYEFTYYIETKDLSTDQGVFWEILGYPRQDGLYVKSDMYNGTNPWKRGHMGFTVDGPIQAVMIRLRRLPSQKFDNLLKGTVWIDDVTLTETSEAGDRRRENE